MNLHLERFNKQVRVKIKKKTVFSPVTVRNLHTMLRVVFLGGVDHLAIVVCPAKWQWDIFRLVIAYNITVIVVTERNITQNHSPFVYIYIYLDETLHSHIEYTFTIWTRASICRQRALFWWRWQTRPTSLLYTYFLIRQNLKRETLLLVIPLLTNSNAF